MCSQYGGATPTYTVGAGTAYPNSSNLPSATLSNVTLYVENDFIIDNNFTLNNAIVKVNTDKKISVVFSDFINFNYTYFTLNNTKVFPNNCSTFWKGIEMTGLTSITVTNNSILEEADNAIYAINNGAVNLNISNSTFNRNKIGINLDATNLSPYVIPPLLSYFVNNKFTNSPMLLGGGGSQVSTYGLSLINVYNLLAFNYGNSNNIFNDLNRGINIEGNCDFTTNSYTFASNLTSIRCRTGSSVNVQYSSFLDVKAFGIFCTGAAPIRVEHSYFRHDNDNFVLKRMISIVDPITSTLPPTLINDNSFYSDGNTRFILYDASNSQNFNADITNNIFTFAGTRLEGILLRGNQSSTGGMLIRYNTFDLDANNTPPSISSNPNWGIRSFDTKNNISIAYNTFKSGYGFYTQLIGSSGFLNEFSYNTFVRGTTYVNTDIGLNLRNFQNATICSNTDYSAASPTFLFEDENFSTNFSSNITENYFSNSSSDALRITRTFTNSTVTPFIGVQEHKNNTWINGAGLVGENVINEASTAIGVDLSRFNVHTSQPSNYFPANVLTPNAPGSAFFQTLSGTPISCVPLPSPSAYNVSTVIDPVLDPLIAQARFSDYTKNTAQVYDAELHLMRKIKKYPLAYNGNQMYKNFMQQHQGKNKEKIRTVEDAIDENSTIDDITKNKIIKLQDQIKDLEDNNKKYNKDKRPTKDEIQAYYQQRVELDKNIATLYKEHKANKKIKDKEAKNSADNIAPTTLQERLTKEVYQIYLDAQINNDGKLTDVQRNRMKQIAATCFNEGGMIVYTARGYLSEEDYLSIQKDIEICEPKQNLESYPTNNLIQTQINKENPEKPIIFPNPAKESITINLSKNVVDGSISFMDLTGKIISSYKLNTGVNTIQHRLSNGIYLVNIKMSDGQSITQKLSISY